MGRSLLEIVNPKDVSAINDSLSPYNSLPVVGELDNHSKCITGSKRSFAFRLKSSKQLHFDSSVASSSTRYQHTIPGKSTVSSMFLVMLSNKYLVTKRQWANSCLLY